jgi:hypothetical protein
VADPRLGALGCRVRGQHPRTNFNGHGNLRAAGLAQAGLAQAGLAQAGLAQAGLAQAGLGWRMGTAQASIARIESGG